MAKVKLLSNGPISRHSVSAGQLTKWRCADHGQKACGAVEVNSAALGQCVKILFDCGCEEWRPLKK